MEDKRIQKRPGRTKTEKKIDANPETRSQDSQQPASGHRPIKQ